MKTKALDPTLVVSILTLTASATTFTASAIKSRDFVWALSSPNIGNTAFAPVVMDDAGNSYQASYAGCPLCAVKIHAAGQVAWTTPLYGNAISPAFPKPLVIDPAGNVYIAGF